VERTPIGIGVDRHRRDAQLPGGSLNAESDLTPVCNQNFSDSGHDGGEFYRMHWKEQKPPETGGFCQLHGTGRSLLHLDTLRSSFILLFFICLAGTHRLIAPRISLS